MDRSGIFGWTLHKVTWGGFGIHFILWYCYTLCLKTYFYVSSKVLLPSANPQPISMQKSPNNTLSKSFIQSMYFSCAYHFIFVCSGLLCMYIRVALILKESYALSDTIFASIICHIIILCGTQKVDCCMWQTCRCVMLEYRIPPSWMYWFLHTPHISPQCNNMPWVMWCEFGWH